MLTDASFRQGLREASLVFLAVAAFGIAYGVLAVDVGFPVWLTVLSSVVIVSGAAQFAMVGLIGAGAAPVLIAATGLALRHLPMSAALAQLIGPQSLRTRLRLAFVLVDETFGLTVGAAGRGVADPVAYKTGADVSLYSGWVLGTLIGAVFGTTIDPGAAGVGALFGLLFLGLAIPMVKTRRHWRVAVTSVVGTLVAVAVLPGAWQVTIAAFVASLVGVRTDE